MLKRLIKTIHYLRVYFLAFFVVALFYYIGLQPINVSKFIGAKLSSAVGMSTSVPENPFNKVALQLKEKEQSLNEKENSLYQREAELAKNQYSLQTKLMKVMIAGIFVLLLLILFNYYLDYRRKKSQ